MERLPEDRRGKGMKKRKILMNTEFKKQNSTKIFKRMRQKLAKVWQRKINIGKLASSGMKLPKMPSRDFEVENDGSGTVVLLGREEARIKKEARKVKAEDQQKEEQMGEIIDDH